MIPHRHAWTPPSLRPSLLEHWLSATLCAIVVLVVFGMGMCTKRSAERARAEQRRLAKHPDTISHVRRVGGVDVDEDYFTGEIVVNCTGLTDAGSISTFERYRSP